MGKLPIITGKTAIKTFQKEGWRIAGQEGSHVVLKKTDSPCNLTVPVHGKKNVKRGLLRKLISKSGLSVDEFVELLDHK